MSLIEETIEMIVVVGGSSRKAGKTTVICEIICGDS